MPSTTTSGRLVGSVTTRPPARSSAARPSACALVAEQPRLDLHAPPGQHRPGPQRIAAVVARAHEQQHPPPVRRPEEVHDRRTPARPPPAASAHPPAAAPSARPPPPGPARRCARAACRHASADGPGSQDQARARRIGSNLTRVSASPPDGRPRHHDQLGLRSQVDDELSFPIEVSSFNAATLGFIVPAGLWAAYEAPNRAAHGVIAATVQQRLTTPGRLIAWVDLLHPLRRAKPFKRTLSFVDAGAHSGAELEVGRYAAASGCRSRHARTGARIGGDVLDGPMPSGTSPMATRSCSRSKAASTRMFWRPRPTHGVPAGSRHAPGLSSAARPTS